MTRFHTPEEEVATVSSSNSSLTETLIVTSVDYCKVLSLSFCVPC